MAELGLHTVAGGERGKQSHRRFGTDFVPQGNLLYDTLPLCCELRHSPASLLLERPP
jgi:hypothetical protein